jgi:hypothetical protein
MLITKEYLREHPDHVFVFGDNLLRQGKGGAATLRDEPNTYGFITKKAPNNKDESFYRPDEYVPVFAKEVLKLGMEMVLNPEKTYLISKLGAGLANKYGIWEKILEPQLKVAFEFYPNVRFLWEEDTNEPR